MRDDGQACGAGYRGRNSGGALAYAAGSADRPNMKTGCEPHVPEGLSRMPVILELVLRAGKQ